MNLLFFFQFFFFFGDFDDFRLSINVCTICCFNLGFRNAKQAFRGYGGTIKDISHTQDVSSRVIGKYPLSQNLILEFFVTFYFPMTLISVSSCSFSPTTKILKPILSDLVLFYLEIIAYMKKTENWGWNVDIEMMHLKKIL